MCLRFFLGITLLENGVEGLCDRKAARDHYVEDISDKDLKIMVEDCDFQEKMNLYGDPVIDKPDWLRWKETLEREKKRRRL